VRVKDHRAILETIDDRYMNRGLTFGAEMAPYCGGMFRVHSRVDRIIDEKTGKMIRMKNACIILEGVVCQARYNARMLFCPRATYAYWREIWLERVVENQEVDTEARIIGSRLGRSLPSTDAGTQGHGRPCAFNCHA
jgi:hypothetical protein